MSVFVKEGSSYASISVLLLSHFVFSLMFILPACIVDKSFRFKLKSPSLTIGRIVFGGFSMLVFFYNLSVMPLATALLFLNTSPIFIPLLLYALFRKAINLKMLYSASIGLFGLALILHPNLEFNYYLFLGVLNGMLSAMAFVFLRQASQKDSATSIVFYYFVICSLVTLCFTAHELTTMTEKALWYSIAVGFTAAVFQYSLTKAMRYMPSNIVAAILFIEVPFAAIIGWWLWGEKLGLDFLIGACFILIGSLLIYNLSSKQKLN
tara:strand:- start:11074 stop:11868 length:795 start_codon:yes stop_codon:yes gene_type:complete